MALHSSVMFSLMPRQEEHLWEGVLWKHSSRDYNRTGGRLNAIGGPFTRPASPLHPPLFIPTFLAIPPLLSSSTMSTRHSFLSTTGLIRPMSAASFASPADDYLPDRFAPSGVPTSRRMRKSAVAPPQTKPTLTTRAGIIPLGPTFLVCMAVALSLLFIGTISLAFIADEDKPPATAAVLNDVAANSPGVSGYSSSGQQRDSLGVPRLYCSARASTLMSTNPR